MADKSPIGSAIVLLIGVIIAIWLPVRIYEVWTGTRSSPPVTIEKTFLGVTTFKLTGRNFPMAGIGFMFGVVVFAVGLGLEGVLSTIFGVQIDAIVKPVVVGGILLGNFFGLIAQMQFWVGHPRLLMPPHLRDENEDSEQTD